MIKRITLTASSRVVSHPVIADVLKDHSGVGVNGQQYPHTMPLNILPHVFDFAECVGCCGLRCFDHVAVLLQDSTDVLIPPPIRQFGHVNEGLDGSQQLLVSYACVQ